MKMPKLVRNVMFFLFPSTLRREQEICANREQERMLRQRQRKQRQTQEVSANDKPKRRQIQTQVVTNLPPLPGGGGTRKPNYNYDIPSWWKDQ